MSKSLRKLNQRKKNLSRRKLLLKKSKLLRRRLLKRRLLKKRRNLNLTRSLMKMPMVSQLTRRQRVTTMMPRGAEEAVEDLAD
jgi:hypothetical protein